MPAFQRYHTNGSYNAGNSGALLTNNDIDCRTNNSANIVVSENALEMSRVLDNK